MKIFLFFLVLFWTAADSFAQTTSLPQRLVKAYDQFREPSLTYRRFKHQDIQPLIQKRKNLPLYEVTQVGESFEGRSISMLKTGNGPHKVFLWSQMHGDEPTATMAIFDILRFLETKSDGFDGLRKTIRDSTTLYFVPMLNPDGAEKYQRRNAQGFDLNRDAIFLQGPEAKILRELQNSIKPEYGFNLHDQSGRYSVGRSAKTAAISFLATAYDYPRSINKVRQKSMQLIVRMNRDLQQFIPGQVARYSDEHEPRGFGDNFQKWGTTLMLIESGGYPGDPEKQYIRKLNFMVILSGLEAIATGNLTRENQKLYEDIPENGRYLYDLVVRGATVRKDSKSYRTDLGINRNEVSYSNAGKFFYSGKIEEYGDLSTFFGTREIDASGLTLETGKEYPKTIRDLSELALLNQLDLLKQGYTYIRLLPGTDVKVAGPLVTDLPFHVLQNSKQVPAGNPELGSAATFLLKSNGAVRYAVVNGFVYDLNKFKKNEGSGIVE